MKQIIILFVLANSLFCFAQENNKIDSLKTLLPHKKGTQKAELLNELSSELGGNNPEKAMTYANEAKIIGDELRNDTVLIESYINICTVYYYKGEFDKALQNIIKALTLSEKTKNENRQAYCYNMIGLIHSDQGQAEKAFEYFNKALTIYDKLGNDVLKSDILSDIGSAYFAIEKYDDAINYFKQALEVDKKYLNKDKMASTLNNIGAVYYVRKKYDKALEYFQQSYEYRMELNMKKEITNSQINIGSLFVKIGKINEGINMLHLAEKTGEQLMNRELLSHIYASLSNAYYRENKFKIAYDYMEKYANNRDSLFSTESTKQVAEMQTKYESEKKEAQILLLNKEKEFQRNALERKQQFIYFITVAFFLLVVLAFIALNAYRQKRKANDLLAQKNKEIHAQKEIIEEKNKEVTDSIRYAKRIQTAVLPHDSFLQAIVPNHFVLFKPRDIVSGDFYWADTTQENELLLCTADCTGHGVPGAFMSLIGVNLLNEIIKEKKITQPDLVLNELREKIIRALSTGENEGKDGMDVVFYRLNTTTLLLEYAAAFNSFYVVRDTEIIESEVNKFPVGKFIGDHKPFTLHRMQLKPNDTIYTFTDGFADQFGGPSHKKFMYKQLKSVLLEIQNEPIALHQKLLFQRFEEWRGETNQIDDVLLIGVRV